MSLRIRKKPEGVEEKKKERFIDGPDYETKVPIPDGKILGSLRPTLKGWEGRSWSWWLPKTLAGRIFFLSIMSILVLSIPTLLILSALGIIS
jgi:hypothetical protein